eukprot:10345847-Karenia_brevis.AAC.1
MCMPSLDCLLMRRRLMYLKRILDADAPALQALLAVGCPNKPLEWVKLVLSDMGVLSRTCGQLHGLQPPSVEPKAWMSAIADERWHEWCNGIYFIESVADRMRPIGDLEEAITTWPCRFCTGNNQIFFPTEKARNMHERVCHGFRSSAQLYADSSCTCRSCGTRFSTRLRLIAHLSDRRRTRCLDHCKNHTSPLPKHLADELGEQDRMYRTAARKAGRTQPLSTGRAVRANGTQIGRVSVP